MFRTRNEFREHLRTELGYLRVALPWLVVFVVVQLYHSVMHNVVYYLEAQNGVFGGPSRALVDLGFQLLPEINTTTLPFLPNNGILYSIFAIGGIFILAPFFLTLPHSPVQALWRALFVASISVILRTASFIFTLLPSPSKHCEETLTSDIHSGLTFDPPLTVFEIFFKVGTDSGCGDLMFSSHVMYCTIFACVVTHYSKSRIFAGLLWAATFALCLICVAQRSHYSVDVIVALYTVPMIWLSLRFLLPWDIRKHFRFWLDQPTVKYTEA